MTDDQSCSLEAAHDGYRELAEAKRALEARRREIEAARGPLLERLHNNPSHAPQPVPAEAPPSEGPLAGVLDRFRPRPDAAGRQDSAREDWEALQALDLEEAQISEALSTIGGQMRTARTAASRIVCDNIRADHDAILADVGKAAVALGHALARYAAMHRQLHRAGVQSAWFLPPLPLGDIGDPAHKTSSLACLIRNLVGRGAVKIDARTAPAIWLPRDRPDGAAKSRAA